MNFWTIFRTNENTSLLALKYAFTGCILKMGSSRISLKFFYEYSVLFFKLFSNKRL
jgi:hypothetical protein